jgi:hypothetical protein
MKGIVFTEFLELVEAQFSPEICERVLETSDLPSRGIYTSVGTYPHTELVTLVTGLSVLTGVAPADLVRAFGRHLFGRFAKLFPHFFVGFTSALDFLPRVESFVHLEVRKLYSDPELPTFSCVVPEPGRLEMTYHSSRNFADLAEGLILGCIEHFEDRLAVTRTEIPGPPPGVRFCIGAPG